MAGLRISPEKKRVWMADLRITREKSVSGWLICVFLEKKTCLDGWFAYYSRKKRVLMAGFKGDEGGGAFVGLELRSFC